MTNENTEATQRLGGKHTLKHKNIPNTEVPAEVKMVIIQRSTHPKWLRLWYHF